MQYSPQPTTPAYGRSLARNLGYLLIPLLIGIALLTLAMGTGLAVFEARSSGQVHTGVSVWNVDLSGMTAAEAEDALAEVLVFPQGTTYTLMTPDGDEWTFTPEQLGLRLDADQTAAAAFNIGRSGSPVNRLKDAVQTWYYGRQLAPVLLFDEGQLNEAVATIGTEIEQPAISAAWVFDGEQPVYTAAQVGHQLDREDLHRRLLEPVQGLQAAEIGLLVHEIVPPVYDDAGASARIERLMAEPVEFYFPEPLDDLDLEGVTLPSEALATWIRVEQVAGEDGRQSNQVSIDENAARNWLSQFATQVYRQPVNARYYFNDATGQLVLVAPHINGRELDVEATLQQMTANLETGNQAVPLMMTDITPVAHSGATAAELSITELVSESTTWFSGSSDARKHNIARAAANFYGIVIEPGEEFSFNRFLGTVTEDDGFEEGLIIIGGRTIKGIGGGVCQVSTTAYQAAFWAGFPIVERWEHGYQLSYYNDGEGPGMDATVYSPIVDLRFINNTPHHLLIENYYNEENESLTFKLYSTSMGREIIKGEPIFTNVVAAPTEDVWEFDPDLPAGTVEQFDFAADGADVSVSRSVINADGVVIEERDFTSSYIPWPNVYSYGPGVEPGDYSLVDQN